MLKIKMTMMLHTFENTMDSRLGSFVMTAVKLVPVENFYKDPKATKRTKFHVFNLTEGNCFGFGFVKCSLVYPRMQDLIILRWRG